MTNLAFAYMSAQRFEDAETLLLEALGIQRKVVGEDNPDTWWTLDGLAANYAYWGRFEEAETIYRDLLQRWRGSHGADNSNTLIMLASLAWVVRESGRFEEARPLYAELMERRRSQSSDFGRRISILGCSEKRRNSLKYSGA
jgi:tetratricopeptide (TPR) repeat protein